MRLNLQQFGILNGLQKGDVVSYRKSGSKAWGLVHTVEYVNHHRGLTNVTTRTGNRQRTHNQTFYHDVQNSHEIQKH